MSVVDLDYTVAGVATADLPNWSGAMTRLPSDSYLCLRASVDTATATRTLTGLTADVEYEVAVNVDQFEWADEPGTFAVAVEGQSVTLALGTSTVTFTATGATADLVFTIDGDTSWGSAYVYLNSLVVGGGGGPTPGAIVVTGSTSHLHDTVDIVETDGGALLATLPAYVGYTSTALNTSEDGRTAFVEELRALLPAFNYNPAAHRIRWNGTLYQSDGPGMLRRVRGRDHHLTVPIKAVAG